MGRKFFENVLLHPPPLCVRVNVGAIFGVSRGSQQTAIGTEAVGTRKLLLMLEDKLKELGFVPFEQGEGREGVDERGETGAVLSFSRIDRVWPLRAPQGRGPEKARSPPLPQQAAAAGRTPKARPSTETATPTGMGWNIKVGFGVYLFRKWMQPAG